MVASLVFWPAWKAQAKRYGQPCEEGAFRHERVGGLNQPLACDILGAARSGMIDHAG